MDVIKMNRFKVTRASISEAKKFMKDDKLSAPTWAKRFKADLTAKGNKMFYKKLEIVAAEDVDDVLRRELFKKDSDIPPSRDACFHLCKQRFSNISRRGIMKFLMAQKTLGQNRPAVPKAKQSAGEKLKKYIFECDLVFLKRDDVTKADPKFHRMSDKKLPNLSYMVTTCEKITGITRIGYSKSKDAKIVTPIIMKQIEDMCKQLKVKPKQCGLRSDAGGEMDHNVLKTLVGSTEHVILGPHIENKNRMIQSQFFRILRAKKAKTIESALKKSQVLINQTFNRIHKATPNEIVEKGLDVNKKTYNTSRKEYVTTTKRELQVGDHCRIQVLKKKKGLDYKSYKDMTFTTKLYLVKNKTKKAVPPKYRVNGKWFLIESLLKTMPRDKKTAALIENRQNEEDEEEKKAEVEHEKKRDAEVEADNKRKEIEVAAGVRRSTRKGAQRATRRYIKKNLKKEKAGVEQDIAEDREIEKEKEKVAKKEEVVAKKEDVVAKKKEVVAKKKIEQKKNNTADWTLDRLRSFLKVRNLPITGTKARLKARIRYYIKHKKK